MISLIPVLLRPLPADKGELLCACAQGVLHKHSMTAAPPSVQPQSYPPSDGVRCSDISSLFQDHRLEDNELLRVPLFVPHPAQLSPQCLHKLSPDFPARCVIAPQWHDREVKPPRLPHRVVANAAVKVCARVGVDPVSVELPETEFLRGRSVPWISPILPFPIRRCRRLTAPFLSLRASGPHLLRGCWFVSARAVLFPLYLLMRPGLPSLVYSKKGFSLCTLEQKRKMQLHYHIVHKRNMYFWGKSRKCQRQRNYQIGRK